MEDFKRAEPVVVRDFKTSAHLLAEFMCSEQSPTFRSLHSLLFRGESSAKFSLIPSALRPEKQNEFRRLAEAAGLIVENGGRPLNEDEHIDCELQLIKFFYKTANQKGLPLPPLPYKWHERLQNHWLMTNDDQLKEWIPVELAGNRRAYAALRFSYPYVGLVYQHSDGFVFCVSWCGTKIKG